MGRIEIARQCNEQGLIDLNVQVRGRIGEYNIQKLLHLAHTKKVKKVRLRLNFDCHLSKWSYFFKMLSIFLILVILWGQAF